MAKTWKIHAISQLRARRDVYACDDQYARGEQRCLCPPDPDEPGVDQGRYEDDVDDVRPADLRQDPFDGPSRVHDAFTHEVVERNRALPDSGGEKKGKSMHRSSAIVGW
jgi:hypothetical protein